MVLKPFSPSETETLCLLIGLKTVIQSEHAKGKKTSESCI